MIRRAGGSESAPAVWPTVLSFRSPDHQELFSRALALPFLEDFVDFCHAVHRSASLPIIVLFGRYQRNQHDPEEYAGHQCDRDKHPGNHRITSKGKGRQANPDGRVLGALNSFKGHIKLFQICFQNHSGNNANRNNKN